nr:MAG TPA: hypothetical protein [Caudoviricetes sp.]
MGAGHLPAYRKPNRENRLRPNRRKAEWRDAVKNRPILLYKNAKGVSVCQQVHQENGKA